MLRAGGVVAAVLVSAATVWLAPQYPIVVPLAQGIVLWLGAALGIPLQPILQLGLAIIAAKQPDRAVEIATNALKSLPPEAAADAARTLMESMPAPPPLGGVPVVLVPDPEHPLTAPPPPER